MAIVNEAAVRQHFPDRDPIGQRIGSSPETSADMEIVGVLRDVKYDNIREPAPPTVYVPAQQHPMPHAVFEVRTVGDPADAVPAIREAVRQVDAGLPLVDVMTQMAQIERRFQQEKIFAYAYAIFGTAALLLAAIGLFGLMSYSVARRTGEIGVRMALGARREDVLGLVMRESMLPVVAGLAVGLAAAIAAGRLIAALLFGLAPTDAAVTAVVVIVMLAVAAFASYLPARRASRVDPIVALRCE